MYFIDFHASLLLVILSTVSGISNAFVTKEPFRKTINARELRSVSTDENEAAKQLLDKAAALRAEIAAMEGKSIEQVEEEASRKKENERVRRKEQDQKNAEKKGGKPEISDDGRYFVQIPDTFDDMVRQAARAVERAFEDGKTRQTVRFNLIGEESNALEENEWPGGTQQMYREAAKPLTTALLREVRAPTKVIESEQKRLVPNIIEQDIWDFDGSALHTAEASEGASGDVQALVFPNTDIKYIRDIDKIANAMGPRLFLLVNPFWRNVESWSFNLLAPGAKDKAQKVRIVFDL
jgi:hypothetical protein